MRAWQIEPMDLTVFVTSIGTVKTENKNKEEIENINSICYIPIFLFSMRLIKTEKK